MLFNVIFPRALCTHSVCLYTHGPHYAYHTLAIYSEMIWWKCFFFFFWKLWTDTEGGGEWIRPDIKDNECASIPSERNAFCWCCHGLFKHFFTAFQDEYDYFSPYFWKRVWCTLCVRFHISISDGNSEFIHFSGVEMWEGERREYIMNVRAHMSCRRWFQYHVTVLRVFHATVPISSFLFNSCFKWKKITAKI